MKYRVIMQIRNKTISFLETDKLPIVSSDGILTVIGMNNAVWHIREWVGWVEIEEEADDR